LVFCLGGCAPQVDPAPAKGQAAQEAGERQIAAMAEKHGAKSDWMDAINNRRTARVYGFQIQDAFRDLVGNKALLTVEIKDIYEGKTGCRLVCSPALSPSPTPDLIMALWSTRFVLDLTRDQAQRLAEADEPLRASTFAVVAVPTQIGVGLNSEIQQDGENARGEGDVWIRGTLVDAARLPDGYAPGLGK
jgi:hypothetical protein